ncbi:MAG: metal-dependent transcriptional regulator [Candidatus Omnitrophota bacterium]|jgi:DtxR family Mn-dependent transcriptional regulator
MERTQKLEEALTVIWEEAEKKIFDREQIQKCISDKVNEDVLEDLAKQGYVIIEKDAVKLMPRGEIIARDIIRRQRLAERLLADVLEVSAKETDSCACEFEHILSKEVEESICTLLGHPKECPHGYPIPPGNCCLKAKALLESIVVPLSKLAPGEKGKVVYVLTHKHPQLHKLMSLGIVPGVLILLHQVSPSFVLQVQETQVALEEELAKEIYVKRLK